MIEGLVNQLVKQRILWGILSIVVVGVLSLGLGQLRFESDYKIFFSKDNPQLIAHERNQEIYTKSDNVTFVLAPKDGKVFTPHTLKSIIKLTAAAWKIPFSTRVDSVTNFQYTSVKDDDLMVDNLVRKPDLKSPQQLEKLKQIALKEPMLLNNLISGKTDATAVSVNLTLPDNRAKADKATREVVSYARQLRDKFEKMDPNLKIYLIGQTVVNNTFNEMSQQDSTHLIPVMFLVIVILLQWILRSWIGTFATVVIIAVSVLATEGFMGWVGWSVNQVNVASPIIILTLAVCDCVHLLNNYLYNLYDGKDRVEAMKECLRINLQPVFLTSLTTAMGFLSMNYSDSPPFRELGNISAFGVTAAFILSLTLFPMLVMALPIKAKMKPLDVHPVLDKISDFTINHSKSIVISLLSLAVLLLAFMTKNELNDDTVKYFHKDVPFRQAADYTQAHLTGFDTIDYSLDSGEPNGINAPAFQRKVDAFSSWYLMQPEVVQVSSYTDTMKRLNQNMHNDDPAWHRLPDNRELAAQYLLLYQMSLPYGLDLNNQINADKSSTLVRIRVKNQKAQQLINLEKRGQDWLAIHAPELKSPGSSVSMMFAHIGQRNIHSMLSGSLLALILVTLTLLIALKSFKYGMISLLPNALPAGMAFGLWGIFVGEVNLAVAVIFTITLGIVVDDTVHFMTKYLRGRNIHHYSADEAIRYTFRVVGKPIVTTTIVLSAGFGILAFSSFDVNSSMGLMVSITILIALLWDFFFLPALLHLIDGRQSVDLMVK
jgi:predicted RND superfamily exporter protein